nr:hypothetical protein CFP56_30654 [Quercus suber]
MICSNQRAVILLPLCPLGGLLSSSVLHDNWTDDKSLSFLGLNDQLQIVQSTHQPQAMNLTATLLIVYADRVSKCTRSEASESTVTRRSQKPGPVVVTAGRNGGRVLLSLPSLLDSDFTRHIQVLGSIPASREARGTRNSGSSCRYTRSARLCGRLFYSLRRSNARSQSASSLPKTMVDSIYILEEVAAVRFIKLIFVSMSIQNRHNETLFFNPRNCSIRHVQHLNTFLILNRTFSHDIYNVVRRNAQMDAKSLVVMVFKLGFGACIWLNHG